MRSADGCSRAPSRSSPGRRDRTRPRHRLRTGTGSRGGADPGPLAGGVRRRSADSPPARAASRRDRRGRPGPRWRSRPDRRPATAIGHHRGHGRWSGDPRRHRRSPAMGCETLGSGVGVVAGATPGRRTDRGHRTARTTRGSAWDRASGSRCRRAGTRCRARALGPNDRASGDGPARRDRAWLAMGVRGPRVVVGGDRARRRRRRGPGRTPRDRGRGSSRGSRRDRRALARERHLPRARGQRPSPRGGRRPPLHAAATRVRRVAVGRSDPAGGMGGADRAVRRGRLHGDHRRSALDPACAARDRDRVRR